MSWSVAVRYGIIPEVAWFSWALDANAERGQSVIVRTRRGVEPGTVLGTVNGDVGQAESSGDSVSRPSEHVVRLASASDMARTDELRAAAQSEFAAWQHRIREWNLELELIDVEWMLDREKLVLYVLGGRGADTTKLALQAAAAGFAIEVQPVNADGLVPIESGCGCGHGGTCGRE